MEALEQRRQRLGANVPLAIAQPSYFLEVDAMTHRERIRQLEGHIKSLQDEVLIWRRRCLKERESLKRLQRKRRGPPRRRA